MTHPTVFISYSHDSTEHADRVLVLADRLIENGINCILDQYEISPPDGWPKWMDRHIARSDFVLVICTETYHRRVMGEEEPGKGRGVKWESTLTYQHLYDADAENIRFIPVLFESGKVEHIPTPLRGATYYYVDTEQGYENLYRRLTNQPRTVKPELGKLRKLPPRERKQDRQEHEQRYLRQMHQQCSTLYTEGIEEVAVPLTGVFVMLEAIKTLSREMRTDVSDNSKQEQEEETEKQKIQSEPKSSLFPIPLSIAIQKHRHLVILGDPGSGKTTLLQFVTLCFASEGLTREKLSLDEERVPVQVELRRYDGIEPLAEMLVKTVANLGLFDPVSEQSSQDIARSLLKDWLTEGRLVVLLDGLDEVPDDRRTTAAEAIARFVQTDEGARCRILVTSRIAGYRTTRELGEPFAHYTLRPFTGPTDALPYTMNWLQAIARLSPEEAEPRARGMLAEMGQMTGLQRVMGNPLLLRLAVTVYAEKGELARNRAELYRRYADEVIAARERIRSAESVRWNHRQIEAALEIIAWTLQIEREKTITALAEKVEHKVEGVDDGLSLVNYLRERLGLLVVYGYKQGELVTFRHLTFQEFFVARQLMQAWKANREQTWRFLRPRLHHPRWREPLLLLAGMLGEPGATELVRCILKARSPYEGELHRDLLLAVAIIEDGMPVSDALLDTILDKLLTLFVDVKISRWHHLLGKAMPLLRLSSGRGRYQLLQKRIDDALVAVGRYRQQKLRDTMYAVMQGKGTQLPYHEWLGLYVRAVNILAQLGDISLLLDTLADVLKDERADQVWSAVLESLAKAKQGNPSVVKALVQATTNPDPYIRWMTARALSVEDSSEAAAALIRLAEDNDSRVKKIAITRLGGMWPYPWTQRAAVVLLGALADAKVRWAVLEALWERGILRHKSKWGLGIALAHRDAIYYGLARALAGEVVDDGRWHKEWVDALREATGKTREEIIREAIEALRKEGSESTKAVSLLILLAQNGGAAFGHGDDTLQEAAIGLLGIFGGANQDAISTLVDLLAHRFFYDAPYHSLIKMAENNPQQVVSTLADALKRRDIQKKVAWLLGELGALNTLGATSALVRALGQRDAGIREVAARALVNVDASAPEVVTALLGALHDRNANVRKAVAWTLARLKVKTPEVITTLSQRLSDTVRQFDEDDHSCEEAAQLLWDLGEYNPLIGSLLIKKCVLYWDPSSIERAMETLTRLNEVDSRTVEQVLTDAIRYRGGEDGEGLGHRGGDRERIVEILGRLGIKTPQVTAALLETLQDPLGGRYYAPWALGKIGADMPGVVEALLDLLNNMRLSTQETRASSIHSLLEDKDLSRNNFGLFPWKRQPKRRSYFGTTPKHDFDNERCIENVILSLGRLGSGNLRVRQILRDILNDASESESIRGVAAVALVELGAVAPSTVLSHLLGVSPDPDGKPDISSLLNEVDRDSIWEQIRGDSSKNQRTRTVLWAFASEDPHGFMEALPQHFKENPLMLGYLAEVMDRTMARKAAQCMRRTLARGRSLRSLVGGLVGDEWVVNITYETLNQLATRFTVLEVAELPADIPSLDVSRLGWRSRPSEV